MRFLRLIALVLSLFAWPAFGQAPPEKVGELLQLLSDPEVQKWIALRQAAAPAVAASGAVVPASAPAVAASAPAGDRPADTASAGGQGLVAGQIDAIRVHMRDVMAALPHVPRAMEEVFGRLRDEIDANGRGNALWLVLGFVVLGFGFEWVFWRISAGVRRWIIASSLETAGERVRAAFARLGFGISWIGSFALGTLGAFLIFDWPPMMRSAVLFLLMAVVVARFSLVLGRLLFAPGAPRFRIVPMGDTAAWFWHRRLFVLLGSFAFVVALVQWLQVQAVDYGVWRAVAYIASFYLLAVMLEALWRRPVAQDHHRNTVNWLLTVAFVALLALRLIGAFQLFWLGAVALILYGASHLITKVAAHLQRPAGAEEASAAGLGFDTALVARSVRLVLIVVALLWLAIAWGIDVVALMTSDALELRVMRGIFQVAAVVLLADLLWYVFKAMIERRLAQAQAEAEADAQAGNALRLRTVLPVLRNVVWVALVVISALMALSAVGVEIGPLVAGAGVVGIAVGFGAQTLVKDIVSGMFFLFDDAFRVGEYIQSGSYKGTVESFSLRSVRLRHHRGPVYTVPFGVLGAVQNMSRNWVIDKMALTITYDSNLEKARKLIKGIGQQLAADPEMGPHILEPLKMQGVEQFGDFGIEIRMKMMTHPGEQFVVKRKALAMIKTAFDENGIKFAVPRVQVDEGAGGAAHGAVAAAAQKVLDGHAAPAKD